MATRTMRYDCMGLKGSSENRNSTASSQEGINSGVLEEYNLEPWRQQPSKHFYPIAAFDISAGPAPWGALHLCRIGIVKNKKREEPKLFPQKIDLYCNYRLQHINFAAIS